MPAKHTLQSLRVRGPATFDQAIRVKGQDWPPAGGVGVAIQAVLNAAFVISAARGTFVDTGLAVALPEAGTYLLLADVRGVLTVSGSPPGWLAAKLRNVTDNADVTNSEVMLVLTGAVNTNLQQTGSIKVLLEVNGAKVIKLYAKRDGASSSFSLSQIDSDANGRTRLVALKVS